jgi:hypothetical protein
MTTTRSFTRLFLLLALISTATLQTVFAGPPVIIADTGAVAIRLRALDAGSTLRVLMISLRPGDEDLATAAWLRFHAGAKVVSAYVTNGESGESEQGDLLPGELAAFRRNETFEALTALNVDGNFLNLPDPGSVSDSVELTGFWGPDTLARKLEALIAAVRPHVIILSRDRDGGNASVIRTSLQEFLKTYIDTPALRKNADRRVSEGGQRWRVERFWSETEDGTGITVPTDRVDQTIGRSYTAIARSLEATCFTGGWRARPATRSGRFMLVRSTGGGKATDLLDHVDPRIPASLKGVCTVVRNFAADVQKGRRQRGMLQERMVTVMDSVDVALGTEMDRNGTAMRMLIDMKGSLELLRNALLGVTAEISVSEETLTDRQLTHVRIAQVTGRDEAGTTEVYFPGTERGWVLNEGLKSRLPLTVPGEYRLITPEHVTYDLPWAEHNLRQPVPVRPMMLFLLHRGGTRAKSFVYRIELPFRYAPRLTLEVLTPIVRAVPGERVLVRVTNHSRDGIRDEVTIDDSLAVSTVLPFRLNAKEQSVTDTLHLTWRGITAEGTHILPLCIGSTAVAQCAVRQFTATVDTNIRVVLLTGYVSSPAAEALRRLGLAHVHVARSMRDLATVAGRPDVLIVDRRATTLIASEVPSAGRLDSLARQGTHVIVLSQDDRAWQERPLWPAISLKRDASLGAGSVLESDSLHPLVSGPNRLTREDFSNWIFAAGYNAVTVTGEGPTEIPLSAGKKRPLVVTQRVGNGRMTYVDLALAPQWMSIHPGSFRILANFLSLGGPARDDAR